MRYVVSKGGTFGVVERYYTTEAGVRMLVISWGPQGWITPVPEDDCKQLRSRWEGEAREEAKAWLEELGLR
jgi:hypothetical protein